jgi:hypothetical protein
VGQNEIRAVPGTSLREEGETGAGTERRRDFALIGSTVLDGRPPVPW